jgi:CRISPR-associated endonuclease/helicase Cas3
MIEVSDWFAPETMEDYFIRLYRNSDTFDKARVEERIDLREPYKFYYETISKEFRLIDDKGINVVVNYEHSMELVHEIKDKGISYDLMKRLSKYMVNLRERDFKKMLKERLFDEVIEGIYVLSDREQYDVNTGLVTDNHWLEEILIQ